MLVLSYGCGAYASPVKGGSAVAAMIIAMQVAMGFSEFPNVEILFPTLVPYWAGREVGLRNALVRRLAQRTAELHAEQAAFAELSVQRERARIARELHDIVAHHLAVVVVQAGAGRMARLGPSQRTSERFDAIRQGCGQALAEMSRLVGIIEAETSERTTGRNRPLATAARPSARGRRRADRQRATSRRGAARPGRGGRLQHRPRGTDQRDQARIRRARDRSARAPPIRASISK